MTKTVLITGVSRGIGNATAKLFSKKGWHVIGVSRENTDDLIEGVDHYIQGDISQLGDVEGIFKNISAHYERIDCLVNNAALQICKPILEMTIDEWDSVMKTNLRSVFLFSKYSHPFLQKVHGSIVNVSSVHAIATSILYDKSKARFKHILSKYSESKLEKCYLFGTGPSLENARNHEFSDGYRVVCNTIGKDKELWDWINPHFIVAGDAIYHFGHTTYAKKFRSDLLQRLKESETYFVYPMEYHPIVSREFVEVEKQLLPIPIKHTFRFNSDLGSRYYLPWVGNVFGLLLLPIGCTLSKNIFLWGFDGRAPNDVLFWKNSKKHSYNDEIIELQKEHPMFYEARVPRSDPTKYVRDVFGDELEQILTLLEMDGTHITMMHHSWTPCFQKRYNQSNLTE